MMVASDAPDQRMPDRDDSSTRSWDAVAEDWVAHADANDYRNDFLLPITLELEVTQTEPGVRGDTVSGVTKPATLETGTQVQVPLFVNQGDRIRVDTRTGSYLERA